MNIQAPPNLQPAGLAQLVRAGINDWGGVSPVTPDHVNPEAPWPHLADLERATEAAGRTLVERLAIYPEFARSNVIPAQRDIRDPGQRASAAALGPGSRACPPRRGHDDDGLARRRARHPDAAPHRCRGAGARGRLGAGRR